MAFAVAMTVVLCNSAAMLIQAAFSFELTTKAALLASTSISGTFWIGRKGPVLLTDTNVQLPYQLGQIILDMEACLDADLYYPALLVALTLPEVCIALSLTSDVFVKEKHYSEFIDKYCRNLGMDGLSCYRLRGGVVHRGNAAGHPFFQNTHVVFTTPKSGNFMHGFTISNETTSESAAMIDLASFCSSIKNAVIEWYHSNKDDSQVKTNMPGLLSLRTNGIHPWVVGIPVVASGIARERTELSS